MEIPNILVHPAVDEAMSNATQLASTKGTNFETPNKIFESGRGSPVSENKTPERFIGAILSDTFEITEYIQSGQFGRGWRARVVKGDVKYDDVFIKTLRSSRDVVGGLPATHKKFVKKEIKLFSSNRFARIEPHLNIATTALLFGAVENNGFQANMFYFLSPDLCTAGELFDYLCLSTPPYVQNFDENTARMLTKQLVDGVAFLHSHGVTHRDLKLENIVLTSDFVLKIMDFGAAKWDDEAEECNGVIVTNTIIGTECMQPPELDPRQKTFYNPRAFDVWGVGVILFFLVSMEELVRRRLNFSLFQNIIRQSKNYRGWLNGEIRDKQNVPRNVQFWENLPELAGKFSPELIHLFNTIFDMKPHMRATIEEVKAHPWFFQQYPTEEEYRGDMESRPTKATERDRKLPFDEDLQETWSEIGSVEDAILDCIALACVDLAEGDSIEEKVDIVKGFITYSQEENAFFVGDPAFFKIVTKDNQFCCDWLRGTLSQWLTFFFGFKNVLQEKLEEI
eukprot:m.50763 g.50763  ORF g.50763 m.50763 type:complete len:509 (-) comp7531_c0_seq1:447-1973(-)